MVVWVGRGSLVTKSYNEVVIFGIFFFEVKRSCFFIV